MQLTHHAYLIESLPQDFLSIQTEVLENVDRQTSDVQRHEFISLGVDAARNLIDTCIKAVLSGITRRIVFIQAQSLTHEAQNALLKFFEEPQPGNYFILIVSSLRSLIPTFRSRFEVLDLGIRKSGAGSYPSNDFVFTMMPAERLKLAAKMAEDLAEERITKSDILQFLHGVEGKLHKNIKNPSNKNPAGAMAALEAVLVAEKYLLDRSSSTKILLEHVALMIG